MIFTYILALDIYRNLPYVNYLKKHAKGKIVADCGSGSGIWTWVALYYGAAHVYCIDIHKPTLDHLNKIFNNHPNVTVVSLDLFRDTLPVADIYIHEIFGSPNPFGEAIINFLKNCKKQNITNLFPSELHLYSLRDPKQEKIQDVVYDESLLDESVKSFLEHTSNIYNEKFEIKKYLKFLECSKFSYTSKEKIWGDKLLELTNAPNLNISGDAISWEAGGDGYYYSSLNEYFNNWRYGYIKSSALKQLYMKVLRLDNEAALETVCTKFVDKFINKNLETRSSVNQPN